jgi:phosphonate transport system substrate-binding protein
MATRRGGKKFGLLGASLLLPLLLACRDQEYKPVSLNAPASAVAARPGAPPPVLIGMAPILSAQASAQGMALLAEGLSGPPGGLKVKPFLGSSYQEINNMVLFGQLDAAIVCTGAFSDPAFAHGARVLLVPQIWPGTSYYHALVVVARGSAFRRFQDLEGASIAFTDPLSLTGCLYPLAQARKSGGDPRHFFAPIRFTHSHDRSLAMVASGLVQSASVDSAVFREWTSDHPREAQALRILDQSPDFPAPPIVVPASLSPARAEELSRAFANLSASEAGRRTLAVMGWTGFAKPDATYLKRLAEVAPMMESAHAP